MRIPVAVVVFLSLLRGAAAARSLESAMAEAGALAAQVGKGPCNEQKALDAAAFRFKIDARPGGPGQSIELVLPFKGCVRELYGQQYAAERSYEGPSGYVLMIKTIEGSEISYVTLMQRDEELAGASDLRLAFVVGIWVNADLPAKTKPVGAASFHDAITGTLHAGYATLGPVK